MIELLLQAERALEMGRVDAAERLYRQVAEADPQNAIAVVGLARVALERGDEVGALTLARDALAIDSENTAAARMVARLEEVLTYRGETLPEVVTAETVPVGTVPPVERTSPPATPTPVAAPPPRWSLIDRLFRRRR